MRRVELALAASFLALVAAIQIRGWLFERQVRSIVETFKQIQLEKTPAEVAFRLREQYRPYLWQNPYTRQGPCSRQHCRFEVTLEECSSIAWLLSHHSWTAPIARVTLRILGPLGLRPNALYASLQIDNGAVSGVYVALDAMALKGWASYDLYGSVSTVRNFGSRWHDRYLAQSPNYEALVPGGCTTCYLVAFTHDASREEYERALNFDYSCLRKFLGCSTQAELMPAVARHMELVKQHPGPKLADFENCDLAAVRLMGRDADAVAVVKIKTVVTPPATGPWRYVSYAPLLILKPSLWSRPKWEHIGYDVEAATRISDHKPGQLSPELFRPGTVRIAIFLPFEGSNPQSDCAVVPNTSENLNAVRKGIADDRRQLPPP